MVKTTFSSHSFRVGFWPRSSSLQVGSCSLNVGTWEMWEWKDYPAVYMILVTVWGLIDLMTGYMQSLKWQECMRNITKWGVSSCQVAADERALAKYWISLDWKCVSYKNRPRNSFSFGVHVGSTYEDSLLAESIGGRIYEVWELIVLGCIYWKIT